MLVLSRSRDEELILIAPDGTELTVKIIDIRGDKVRVGLEGPPEYKMHRKEVWESIKKEGARNG